MTPTVSGDSPRISRFLLTWFFNQTRFDKGRATCNCQKSRIATSFAFRGGNALMLRFTEYRVFAYAERTASTKIGSRRQIIVRAIVTDARLHASGNYATWLELRERPCWIGMAAHAGISG